MKKFVALLLLLCTLCVFATGQSRYGIIPKPVSLEEQDGSFRINANTTVIYPANDLRIAEIVTDFSERVNKVSGLKIKSVTTPSETNKNTIILTLKEGIAPEGYSLNISPESIELEASTSQGLLYGIQTIYQLLPSQIYGETVAKRVKWDVPCCKIEDEPSLPYRGFMLDCCRYFMPKEVVLKFIDLLAMHKQNIFHWHLTDDQGWRIEIKKYPRLTEVGAWRDNTHGYKNNIPTNEPHGGFYTQEDAKEVVEYARRRGITVIPEIELPGHATAAIAAYPELSCFPDREYKVDTRWGVMKDVFCPSAATFTFFEDVFTELFAIFPSPYYNIGGDECPRDRWKESQYVQDFMKVMGYEEESQVQIFFVQRMAKFLNEKGNKKVIGWDEIIDGGSVPGTTVMYYRSSRYPLLKATEMGMECIVAISRWCYLDYYQDDSAKEPVAQDVFLPLRDVYNFVPVPDTLKEENKKGVIGLQACLWAEFVPNGKHAEYMAFPRLAAVAENAWCKKENKDWDSFSRRLVKEFDRLDQKGVNYGKAFWNVLFNYNRKLPFPKEVVLTIDAPDMTIHYTTDGSVPTVKSPIYTTPLVVNKGDAIKAQAFNSKGKPIGRLSNKTF